jgi:hypothetical protein
LLSEQSLIRLAEAAGDHALAERRRPILAKGIAAMRSHMWDEEQGCFLGVNREGMRKVKTATIGGMVPLQGSIPTRKQAARMAQALAGPHWNTPVPLPSVDRLDTEYRSDGHRELVAEQAGRLLDNALKVGVSEHYDSQTGAALGVRNLGMSAVLLTIALEGLSPRHNIRVA